MALYGCTLWDISGKKVEQFYVTWRKCVRRLLNLNRSHGKYLSKIVDENQVDVQIHLRILTFMLQIKDSSNPILRLCSKLVFNGSNSDVCKSLNFILWKYGIADFKVKEITYFTVRNIINGFVGNNYSEEDYLCVSNIKDLLVLRENKQNNFSNDDVMQMLEYFCVK